MGGESLRYMGGRLGRGVLACTRIIGGRPEDRCRSEALFLTTKAKSSEISTIIPFSARPGARPDDGPKQMKARGFSRLAALAPPALITSLIPDKLQALRQCSEPVALPSQLAS